MMDKANSLSKLSISLHWIIAILIIGLCAVGLYMTRAEAWALYPVHKSLGVLVLVAAILRVIWRIKNGWPAAVAEYSRLEQITAKIIKWVLITGTIALPLSGMLFSGASGHGFGIFGLVLVPAQHMPGNPAEVLAYSEFWAKAGASLHQASAYLLIAAILLHLAGACKHHFIDRDATLRRMLGK
ncbi:cytochrome b [Undibacterium pigrum]|uniref:Cytochrome b561 n=1 Tax=Undibacterium pigrum TaxID=401470 RepID=A0A318JF61_9BURK|nr:cytochrome b [Undibacterium pigrum]PXX47651.1 cytochrome b561 [Undibacterium pigrum]